MDEEVLPHFIALEHASPLSLAFCGAAALQALPGPAREAVAQAARETEARRFAAMSAPAALRAALARASEPVVASGWRAGPEGQAVLAAYRTR